MSFFFLSSFSFLLFLPFFEATATNTSPPITTLRRPIPHNSPIALAAHILFFSNMTADSDPSFSFPVFSLLHTLISHPDPLFNTHVTPPLSPLHHTSENTTFFSNFPFTLPFPPFTTTFPTTTSPHAPNHQIPPIHHVQTSFPTHIPPFYTIFSINSFLLAPAFFFPSLSPILLLFSLDLRTTKQKHLPKDTSGKEWKHCKPAHFPHHRPLHHHLSPTKQSPPNLKKNLSPLPLAHPSRSSPAILDAASQTFFYFTTHITNELACSTMLSLFWLFLSIPFPLHKQKNKMQKNNK